MFSNTTWAAGLPRPARSREPLSTGFSALDQLLGGGFDRGALVELSGGRSSGKATLAQASCLSALASGKAAAWLDGGNGFWPLAALEAGYDTARFCLVRLSDGKSAMRGAELLLQSAGAVAVVVVDLPEGFVPPEIHLVKLQRLAERAHAALLFLTPRSADRPALGAMVGLRLHLRRVPGPIGQAAFVAQVLRHKAGATHQDLEELARGPDRLRVDSTL